MDFLRGYRPVLTLILPLTITAFLLPPLQNLASKIGLLDHPGSRKIHLKPKPLVGGIAMSLAVAIAGLLFIPLLNMRGFYAGLVLLVITGFLDDFNELSPRYKFAAQIIATAMMIHFSNTSLRTFGDLLSAGSIDFDALEVPMTIIGTVGVCNAINMIDGLDGLAGGVCLTVFGSFAYLSFMSNNTALVLLSLSICGSLMAFLFYNWHPSKLFMGDAGSLFLGFSAAFISIALTQEHKSLVRPVAPLLVLAVPIVDTVTVMIRRLMERKSPFYADTEHLHHILLRLGLGKKQAAILIIMLSCLFSAVAITGTIFRMPEHYLFFFFMSYFAVYFAASFFVLKAVRKRTTSPITPR